MTDIDLSPEAERKYLIRKHGAWYRPNSSGYTGSAIQAGRYTLAEAESITHPNGKDGPRDGMFYVHEDEVQCDDLKAFRALSARVEELETERADWLASQHYRYIGRDGKPVLARAIEDRAEAAEAALTRAWGMGRDDAADVVEAWIANANRDHTENQVMRIYLRKVRNGVAELTPPADLSAALAVEKTAQEGGE